MQALAGLVPCRLSRRRLISSQEFRICSSYLDLQSTTHGSALQPLTEYLPPFFPSLLGLANPQTIPPAGLSSCPVSGTEHRTTDATAGVTLIVPSWGDCGCITGTHCPDGPHWPSSWPSCCVWTRLRLRVAIVTAMATRFQSLTLPFPANAIAVIL